MIANPWYINKMNRIEKELLCKQVVRVFPLDASFIFFDYLCDYVYNVCGMSVSIKSDPQCCTLIPSLTDGAGKESPGSKQWVRSLHLSSWRAVTGFANTEQDALHWEFTSYFIILIG